MPRVVESGARIPSDVPSRPRSFTHISAVDGLRALAIIGVVAYHTRPSLMHGGFLGVTLFFVVSGFFLTRSMLRLFATTDFSYPTFLKGRLKRLWPPVLTTIGATAVLVYCAAPSLLMKARADAAPSALFYSNWWFIFRHQSYFQQSGLPSPLTHLWFTSLIMQFYVLWPIVFVILYQLCGTKRTRALAIGALAVLSTLEMALLYHPGQDVSRLYYGLDTRSAELLVGALLAVLMQHDSPDRGPALRAPRWRRTLSVAGRTLRLTRTDVIDILGAASVVVLVVAFFACDGNDGWLYRGGILFFAALCALIMWCSMHAGRFARVLSCKPLTYFGSRSFSIYLVHYPLLEVMNPATRTSPIPWYGWIGQFVLILLVGEVFFQLVEAMHGTRWLPWIPRTDGRERSHTPRMSALVLGGVGALVTLALVLPLPWQHIADSRAAALRPELSMTAAQAQAKLKAEQKAPPKPSAKPSASPSANASAAPKPAVQALAVPDNLDPRAWKCDPATLHCDARILMVGDSVTAAVQDVVRQHFPNAHVDGHVSRQFGDGLPIMQQAMAGGYDPQVIIYALGTNGAATTQQIDQVVDAAGGRPLYFITERAPVAWVDANNAMFMDAAKAHRNVGVIDWAGTSNGHPEYLYDDGIHPNPLGQEAFAQMIFRAVCAG
ncbi:MAG: acyltransferase family protein [Bifidobacterium sp.]|nr:acyltransferase family protein [Bifidobacterium sp.]